MRSFAPSRRVRLTLGVVSAACLLASLVVARSVPTWGFLALLALSCVGPVVAMLARDEFVRE